MSDELWTYRAQLVRVVDGDTFDLRLDLGFRTYKEIRVRLAGVDTAEIYGVEEDTDKFELGKEQQAFVQQWFADAPNEEWPFTFVSYEKAGKFGRWLGDVRADDEYLSAELIAEWPEVANQ